MNESLVVAVATVLIIGVLTLYSFSLTIKTDVDSWRLARIACIHSHLMASEMMQEDIGIVDTNKLKLLESYGYDVNYQVFDPETDEKPEWMSAVKDMETGFGHPYYLPYAEGGSARYGLPVVYKHGSKNKYALLIVNLDAVDPETEEGMKDMVELREMYVDAREMWQKEGNMPW